MNFDRAQEIIKDHPDVTLYYMSRTGMFAIIVGYKSHYLTPDEFHAMDEADFLYEVIHTIRLADLENEECVTQIH